MAVFGDQQVLQSGSDANASEEFTLTITAERIDSTDPRFDASDLKSGDDYKPLKVWFERADGTKITRQREPHERHISNKTLPYLAFQLYEKEILDLAVSERREFPVHKESSSATEYKGIFTSKNEYSRISGHSAFTTLTYKRSDGGKFVVHSWNIFSTLNLVQECLKRFGNPGDQFVLIYREKGTFDLEDEEIAIAEEEIEEVEETPYQNKYSSVLLISKNIVFRGAPGTGKTYLARQIAADIVSEGKTQKFSELDTNQKRQVEFVQFHPSYDYSDFVEGLRPRLNDDGTMGFELQDGIFKEFATAARRNYEDSRKSGDQIRRESSVKEAIEDFIESIEPGVTSYKTTNGNEFFVSSVDETHVYVSIPGNKVSSKLGLNRSDIETVLEAEDDLRRVKDLRRILNTVHNRQEY